MQWRDFIRRELPRWTHRLQIAGLEHEMAADLAEAAIEQLILIHGGEGPDRDLTCLLATLIIGAIKKGANLNNDRRKSQHD